MSISTKTFHVVQQLILIILFQMLWLTVFTLFLGAVSCAENYQNKDDNAAKLFLKKFKLLLAENAKLDTERKKIVRYWNEENKINSHFLNSCCYSYISGRITFIKEIEQANILIEKHNLTYQLPILKYREFLNVDKYETSLNLTVIECNVTIRIAMLNDKLNELDYLNSETNAITNNTYGHSIDITDVREIAIPAKKIIVKSIKECMKEVELIRQYCLENEVVCDDPSLTNDEYYENKIRNAKDDLLKLNDLLSAYVVYQYVQPTVFSLVFVISFTGNCILLVIFYKDKKFRIPQNMIIFNLALGDSLSLIINLPLYHAYLATGAYNGTRETARIIMFCRYFSFGLSVFSTVALCLQRYSATLKASNYIGHILRQSTSRSAKMVNASIWFVAGVMAIPHAVHSDVYFFDTFMKKRKLYITTIQVIYLLQLITLGILPFLAIAVLSWLTVRRFRIRAKKIPEDIPQLNRSYQIKILSRSTVVTAITPIVFACAWLPFLSFLALRNFGNLDINSLPDATMNVIACSLLFLGCSFNPIGLYVASGKFRRYMRTMFGLGPRKSSLKYQPKRDQMKALSAEPPTRVSDF
ncbi:hypothetical protein C0J52_09005 [Blattella germanica]|nr:hypothetical protein C0J52_09005 [Blattella germanica]